MHKSLRLLVALTTFIAFACSYSSISFSDIEATAQSIQIAQNRLASIEDRGNALDSLVSSHPEEALPVLMTWMRNHNEWEVLQHKASQHLIQMEDAEIVFLLREMVDELDLTTENRKLALYTLWKKEPIATEADLVNLADNAFVDAELRQAALSYLRFSEEKPPVNLLVQIVRNKQDVASVRSAALTALKELGLIANILSSPEAKTVLIQVLKDTADDPLLRKAAIFLASDSITQSEFEDHMMLIVGNPSDDAEVREYALDYLLMNPSFTLLPKLKNLLTRERNEVFLEELARAIATLQSE